MLKIAETQSVFFKVFITTLCTYIKWDSSNRFLFIFAILSKFESRHGICSRWHELKSDGGSKIKKLMPLCFIQTSNLSSYETFKSCDGSF